MKFGAHEVMEASEILNEKMNMINHLAMYEQEAQSEQLRSMIRRHMESAIMSYDLMVAYTHDYSARQGMQPPVGQPDVNVERIKYGLRNPQPAAPARTGRFNDLMIQHALLAFHKASAACHIQRGLEVTDPNLRQMFLNGANTCFNEAYEVFLMMNEQGAYQVPTMDNHTAKTYLHTFQPMNQQQYQMHNQQQPQQQYQQYNPSQRQPQMQQAMQQAPFQPAHTPLTQQTGMDQGSMMNPANPQSPYLHQ